MPNYHFRELDESIVFPWIERLRDKTSTGHERLVAETSLFSSLRPIASWIAHLPSNPREYDTEQVVNDAICKLFVVYVSNPDFRFRSCGHLVRLLGQITTNERRLEYRRNNRAKRVPQDADGHRLPIESLNLVQCDCPSNSQDTTCECENNELIEHCLRWLCDSNHRRVFLMLMADFTWAEMAMKLNVDRKTIRRWVNEMRRILAPRTSRLKPQASHLKPQASSLTTC